MSCPSGSTILQMAHGSGSATFPHPTTAGSMIVMLGAYDGFASVLATTDNAGNLYDISPSDPVFNATDQVAIQYTNVSGGSSTGVLSAQTVTAHWSGGTTTPDVWIYELNKTTSNICFNDHNQDPPASSTPTGSGLFLNNSCAIFSAVPGNCYVCFGVCAVRLAGGNITGVAAPYTFDTPQNGNGAAYFIEQNLSNTDTVQFIASGSTNFVISEAAFEAVFATAANFCGCMASPAVGNPLID